MRSGQEHKSRYRKAIEVTQFYESRLDDREAGACAGDSQHDLRLRLSDQPHIRVSGNVHARVS